MNKLAFLVPVYPPDFGYLKQLYNSYIHFNIYKQADLYFIFTNEEEKIHLGDYHYSIIYDTNLGVQNKILYGNKSSSEYIELVNSIKNRCKRFFINNEQSYKLDTELYLWFNQPCIYKNSTLESFFSVIDYDKIIYVLFNSI